MRSKVLETVREFARLLGAAGAAANAVEGGRPVPRRVLNDLGIDARAFDDIRR